MDLHGKCLRLGAWIILLTVMLRLWATGWFQPVLDWLERPDVQSFLIYLETGRKVRFSPFLEENTKFVGESSAPCHPMPEAETALPCFSVQDASLVDLTCSFPLKPDMEALLQRPLVWNLLEERPTVLILHTHTTESYTKTGEPYAESAAFRTLDANFNMLSIGDRMAQVLSSHGIRVIHDRELHDYPSYNGSYNHARSAIEYYLARYPGIRLVLDLHRDASGDLTNQFRPVACVNGVDAAQLMMVVGTDYAGLSHPNWQENLSLAAKLHTQLERIAPGITRPINLRSQRFNQDLSPGALLIEVGAAGNTHPEALLAAEILANAIVQLAKGANTTEDCAS